jgi:hypothetical protein
MKFCFDKYFSVYESQGVAKYFVNPIHGYLVQYEPHDSNIIL